MANEACIDPDTAANFASRTLPAEERAAVERHIDACARCRELVSLVTKAAWSITQESPGQRDATDPWSDVVPRGTRIGPYEVRHPLSAGGMGIVYAAYDARLDRLVALKGLIAEHGDPEQLRSEAKVMAQLAHPNVVPVYDLVSANGQDFIAMELVTGQTLRQWHHGQPRTWKQIVDAFLEVGRGLSAAHGAGIVHGDVKPGNVLVGDDGRVRVTDFGLARWSTLGGHVGAGTPVYFAPEQRKGERASRASDQWAFFASLHEALFDALPGKPVQRVRSVPRALRRLLERGLAEAPEQRFESMDEVVRRLRAIRERDLRWLIAASATMAVVAAVSFAVGGRRGERAQCEAAISALAPVWTPDVHVRSKEAFHRTGLAYADETFERVSSALSEWQASFDAQRAVACEQAAVVPFERRVSCLEDSAREARALVVQLLDADQGLVTRAVGATQALPSSASCGVPAGPTELAPRSQAIEAVRESMATARAVAFAGRYPEALELAKKADAEAQAVAEPHLVASARALLGGHQALAGEYQAAGVTLSRAIYLAELAQEDRARAFAWSELVAVEYWLGHHQQVVNQGPIALGACERIGDVRLATVVQQTIGSSLSELGKSKEAIAMLQEAVDRLTKAFGADDRRTSAALSTLANAQAMAGDLEAAVTAHSRALEAAQTGYGPTHPETAIIQQNLGDDYLYGLRTTEAATQLAQSVALLAKSKGEKAREVALGRTDLGFAQLLSGKPAEAAREFSAALAIFEEAFPKHPSRALALLGKSLVQEAAGGPPDLEALELARTLSGDLPPFETGRVLLALGIAKKDVKLVTEAKGLLDATPLPLVSQQAKVAEAFLASHR